VPLDWSELSLAIGPVYFTVTNARPGLAAMEADPWEDFWSAPWHTNWLREKLRQAV